MRWNVAGRMATAWLLTLPAAGAVGAGSYAIAHVIGGDLGVCLVLVLLVAAAASIYLSSRKSAVSHHNVNAEWSGSLVPHPRETIPA